MRFFVLIIVTAFILFNNIKANDCNYKLKLTNENINNDLHVGDFLIFKLYLSGEDIINVNKSLTFDVNGIYYGSNFFQQNPIEESKLEQKILIEAKEAGLYQIGPYKLTIGNCIIESNTLEITIQESRVPIKTENTISFTSNNINIKLGDTAKVFMKANFRNAKIPHDENNNLSFFRGTYTESITNSKGISDIQVTIELKIFPLKKGTFIINSDYFYDIDNLSKVNELTVKVE